MSNDGRDMSGVTKTCSEKYSHISFDKLVECAKSQEGDELLHESGELTNSLRPKLNYVPWIVVNGEHTQDMQGEAEFSLNKFICKQFEVNLFLF